jgi:hypothetical protein
MKRESYISYTYNVRVDEWTMRPVAVVQKAFFKSTTSDERLASRFDSSLYNNAAERTCRLACSTGRLLSPAVVGTSRVQLVVR